MKKYIMTRFVILLAFVMLFTAGCSPASPEEPESSSTTVVSTDKIEAAAPAMEQESETTPPYYPTTEWKKSSPETQGMDSNQLTKVFHDIKNKELPLHSIIIIRNGYIVAEAYFEPYTISSKHNLYSVTKSLTSTLVGIAINEGYIKGVNQKVIDIFPDIKIEKNDLNTESITIKDLLTMSAGHTEDYVGHTYSSMNWPQDFFNLPFSFRPGEKFLYDSSASHLLAEIIYKTTGKKPEEYAKEHIFTPLGITDYNWEMLNTGINTGGWGLQLKPRDMAKFGYLFLKKGKWEEKQLVPEEWVKEATSKHIESYWGDNKGDNYGYQWWMNPYGGYRADGYAGQYIVVMPEYNLITVFTGEMNNEERAEPFRYMKEYILPSVKSDIPLKKNAAANRALGEAIMRAEEP
ncbi:MAG: beta-lactamase family protein [Clostridia bacterium]|nr:beta-lactamase family protein [Clostridia bacterium]